MVCLYRDSCLVRQMHLLPQAVAALWQRSAGSLSFATVMKLSTFINIPLYSCVARARNNRGCSFCSFFLSCYESSNSMARCIRHSSLLRPDTRASSDQQQQGNQAERQLALQHQHSLHTMSDAQQHQHSLDIVFYIIHLVMSAIHKRVLVTKREQLGFECAMAIFAGALLMRIFFRPLYTRIRPQLVFAIHILLTVIRASVVYTMASKQAVHFRVGVLVEDNHTAGVFVTTMLAILGGPFRLFEMMGLQQPWTSHAIVSVVYLVVHPMAAATGIRLACSNAMFYQVHAVHDAVSAVVDALLDAVTGMPMGQQQTCSSCAGVTIYSFMCLFASVALPLYLMYVWEQGAQQRSQQAGAASADSSSSAGMQLAAGSLAAGVHAQLAHAPAATQRIGGSHSSTQAADVLQEGSQARQECLQPAAANSTQVAWQQAASANTNGSSSTGLRRGITRWEAICMQAEALAAEHRYSGSPIPSFRDLVTNSTALVRWGTHMVVLLVLFVACWLVSSGFALVVLPRVLSSKELYRWCPNRPFAPYVIAGEIYEGL